MLCCMHDDRTYEKNDTTTIIGGPTQKLHSVKLPSTSDCSPSLYSALPVTSEVTYFVYGIE